MKLCQTAILAFLWLVALYELVIVTADDDDNDNDNDVAAQQQCTSMSADGTTCLDPSLAEQEDNDDDDDDDAASSSPYPPTCGLYMAKSSIPNAGWGMYANREIAHGEDIVPLDMVVQVYDAPRKVREGRKSWLLSEYVWNSDMTKSQFDADEVNSVIPGLGMLANSHPGLVNAANEGSLYRRPWTERSNPVTGAFTHYQDLTFTAADNIAKGQEIFVEYGDNWFLHRENIFGPLPLSMDFRAADDLLLKWKRLSEKDEIDHELAQDVWDATTDIIQDYDYFERLYNALPQTGKDAAEWVELYPEKTTARATVPEMIRSQEWLDENGMCLDNIQVKDADEKGKGAFASRFLPAGTLVAPAPVIHLSRDDMRIVWEEGYDVKRPNSKRPLWEGDQLLLNYCYGSPLTSLLFFPYAPAVNLINHGQPANVAIRWSNHSKAEMMEWTMHQVLEQNEKAGLMMEIYALRDIQPGEEILLDYGDDWQHEWDMHESTFVHPVHSEDYKVAWDYDNGKELFTEDDPRHPPPYVETRCWLDYDEEGLDEEGYYPYVGIDSDELDDTLPCTLIGKEQKGKSALYKIRFYDEDKEEDVKIRGVEWNFITYVDRAYTGNQHLRQGFRHFIELPDEMIPLPWRDMGEGLEEESECGLYMAESAIPHSGLGMYTARNILKNERVSFGDIVIQVEDYFDNTNLRLKHNGINETEKEWLLEHYYWTGESGYAMFDAGFIESMVPGFGMLANSHTGLHNSAMRLPYQPPILNRGMDPGAGASTTYHDVHYVAEKNLVAGEEIFVEYGDNYFTQREDLSFVPLSTDFKTADKYLAKFNSFAKKNMDSEFAADLFDIMATLLKSSNTRLANALPRTLEDAKVALKKGSADISVPNKVRSMEWLKENGACIDNMVADKSRIIQAGYGAFATRRIKKGDIISPVPVVQIRREHLDIYDTTNLENPTEIWYEGKQIFLNYCIGHPESSVLLYPYAPTVNYVNHHATKFNAELRWSTHSSHKADWLNMKPRELTRLDHAGLIMDLVATRDIEVGEEVFLHYGNDWDQKWNEYEAQWKPEEENMGYIPASVLNKQVEWLRTQEELVHDPYPENVFTGCFLSESVSNADSRPDAPKDWRYTPGLFDDASNVDECDVIARETQADSIEVDSGRDSYRPPRVTYTVSVPRRYQGYHRGPLYVKDVPRTAIVFFDRMYANDQYQRQAFRHEIGLPEEMLPDAWRDLKKNS